MAGDVKVAVGSTTVSTSVGGSSVSITKTGFGPPKAAIIIVTYDGSGSPSAESKASIGFSDFTNDYCISHQDEDASAKVDCDAIKSNTKSYWVLNTSGGIDVTGTISTVTDGLRLDNTAGESASQPNTKATAIMFGGADLAVDLRRSAINSSQDGTATITHSGFTDGNDKLIFFIGTDISGEDSANSGINNSFGVCHATGSDAGGWTFVQRCMGWASDHGNVAGSPSAIISTDRVLDILTETAGQDWGLEVTALDHSPAEWTVTTRDNGSGAGMEVYSLALDLDDRSAKVGSVDGPFSGTTWTPSVALGFTPQYVGLGVTTLTSEDIISGSQAAGTLGISSNTGSGEETYHSWFNEDLAGTTNTNNLFRSRVMDLRPDDVSSVFLDMSHSSFNSGDWTYTINSETLASAPKWFYWTIEEAAAAGEVIVAAQGSYSLNGQASNLLWAHKMPAVQGSYALNGQPAVTFKSIPMVAAQGSYALNGQASNLLRTHIMLGDQGSYLLNGQAANLLWNHLVGAVQGSYLLTGFAAVLSRQITIIGTQGSYTLTGFAADLLWKHLITAAQGSYAYTGFAADTRVGFTMEVDQGSYTLIGFDALFPRTHVMIGAQGSYSLDGQVADLLWNHLIATTQGSYSLTGQPAITFVTAGETLTAVQGSYILTGQPAILTFLGGVGFFFRPIFRPRRRE